MKIRKATMSDSEEISRMYFEFKNMLQKFLPTEFKLKKGKRITLKDSRKIIKKKINKKNSIFLVAEKEKEICGFLMGVIKKKKFRKKISYGEMKHLYVKKQFRNENVSSKLKERLFLWFKKNNCRYVALDVLTNNPSKQIYKKWGFKTVLENMRKKLN